MLILRGRHQGKVGYYDDDDDGAIVYLGAPFSSDAVRLKHADIPEDRREERRAQEMEAAVPLAREAARGAVSGARSRIHPR